MKDFGLKYLDKFYHVEKESLNINSIQDDLLCKHPMDLQEQLEADLGVDYDLATIIVNEWMYNHGIRNLSSRWSQTRWKPQYLEQAYLIGVDLANYSDISITSNCIALGSDCIVSGSNSIAIGSGAQAIGDNAIAIGAGAIARGNEIAINTNNQNNTGAVLFNGIDISSQIGDALNHGLNIHPYE